MGDGRPARALQRAHHGGVDHLALVGLGALNKGKEDAHGAEHAAAGKVAQQVEREERVLVLASDGRQHAGDRDVVDVVPGHVGVRAGLPKPGHARVHQPRVALQDDLRPEAQPLHHARPERLDEHVRAIQQLQHRLDALRLLQVQCDRPLPPARGARALPAARILSPGSAQGRLHLRRTRAHTAPHVAPCEVVRVEAHVGAIHPHDVRAKVRQDHACSARPRSFGGGPLVIPVRISCGSRAVGASRARWAATAYRRRALARVPRSPRRGRR